MHLTEIMFLISVESLDMATSNISFISVSIIKLWHLTIDDYMSTKLKKTSTFCFLHDSV